LGRRDRNLPGQRGEDRRGVGGLRRGRHVAPARCPPARYAVESPACPPGPAAGAVTHRLSAWGCTPCGVRGWWTCDAPTEPDDGRLVGLPRPGGDLPGDESHLAAGRAAPRLVRREDPQVGRSAARRPAAAREPAAFAVPAARGNAPVLA